MNPSTPRSFPVLLAFVVGVLVGGAGLSLALGPSRTARHGTRATSALPTDPEAFIPAAVHGLLVADIDRLRASRALAPWFSGSTEGEPCEAALLRRVRRVAAGFGSGLDEVGVAFAGDLASDALLACARSRAPAGSVLERTTYRGVALSRLAPRRQGDVLPPSNAFEIVYLPGGVVLAGTSEMVRRMIDRGLSPERDDGMPNAMSELRRRLGTGFDAIGVTDALSGSGVGAGGRDESIDPSFAHVRGVAVGIRGSEQMEVSGVLGCDDYDSPRAVADGANRLRDGLATQLRLPALAEPLRRARVERGATDVRIETSFTAAELDALSLLLRSLWNPGPAQPPPSSSSPAP